MDIFAHRIHKATFLNGVVRLECSTLTADTGGKFDPDAPVPQDQVTYALHLPIQGFLRSLKEMRDLAEKLRDDGVLKSKDGQQGDQGRQGGQRALRDLSEDDRGSGGGSDQFV